MINHSGYAPEDFMRACYTRSTMGKKRSYDKASLAIHKKLGGKIEMRAKKSIAGMEDLKVFYTPGVAAVSLYVKGNAARAKTHTIKKNTVAVISDGSAVLGLGNIGALGALPVMEGKAMIFKEFAGVDAFPIVLDTQDTDEIVNTIKHIAPGFGGINLEDFAAPRCFDIEARLQNELDIPVMHDDQHGTAIVALAALINAAKVVKKDFKKLSVAVVGAGAAGRATANLLLKAGIRDILVMDRKGILTKTRKGISGYKKELARQTNKRDLQGSIPDGIKGRDVVIGVSGPNIISKTDIRSMNDKAVVVAMANPIPEIDPAVAKKAGAYVIATGRSDYPNQVNNALVFPGFFRGALDGGVRKITDGMKIRAAKALAGLVKKPTPNKIIPSIFDKRVVKTIANAVKRG